MEKVTFTSDNLGKEVILKSGDPLINGARGMIVGYDNVRDRVIISFPRDRMGWRSLGKNDSVFISSPLNRSYRYAKIEDVTIV